MNTFGQAVAKKRGEKSYRKVAPEIGIDHSVVARIEHGNLPNMKNFLKVVRWLGIPVEDAIKMLGVQS